MSKTIIVKKEPKLAVAKKTANGWSTSEINFLKKNYKILKMCELAKNLKKSIIDIHAQAVTLGLTKTDKVSTVTDRTGRNFWTKEETKFLKENFSKLSLEEIAEKLNRSTGSISGKAFWLRLSPATRASRKRTRKIWEKEEINYLSNNYGKQSVKRIAKYLKRSEYSVISKASELRCNKETAQVSRSTIKGKDVGIKEPVRETEVVKQTSSNLTNWLIGILTVTNVSVLIFLGYAILLK